MEAPAHIAEGLRNIRLTMHLRWNPKAVLVKPGRYDGLGNLHQPEFDGRFEVWDSDSHGRDYMVMRVQDVEGAFRPPGEWLVELMNKVNPEKYGGDPGRLIDAMDREADRLREIAENDFDDLAGAVAMWCADLRTPKSSAALTFRGQRKLAPGL